MFLLFGPVMRRRPMRSRAFGVYAVICQRGIKGGAPYLAAWTADPGHVVLQAKASDSHAIGETASQGILGGFVRHDHIRCGERIWFAVSMY